MEAQKIQLNPEVAATHRAFEERVNRVVRAKDRVRDRLGFGGRATNYDDTRYEFVGGPRDELRKKHYDKSLRLLWKAQRHLPWTTFRDASVDDGELRRMAEGALEPNERVALKRVRSEEYAALLSKSYTPREKQALVNILSMLGHGEAYAWLVSADLLRDVKSTGARAALTMQVLEEAKHFVVLREVIRAFDCPVPRMSVWEYMLLEGVLRAKGVEKLFGMNVVVEGFALSLFGMMHDLPGLEILKLFHLDESRHTALPHNYFQEFPLSERESHGQAAKLRRLRMLLPAVPVFYQIEPDLAEFGIDSFAFGGSVIRKILHLAGRVGFDLALPPEQLAKVLNGRFNAHCRRSRPAHSHQEFFLAETTTGTAELAVEREVFHLGEPASAQAN